MFYGKMQNSWIQSGKYWYQNLGANEQRDCNNDNFCDLLGGVTKECWILNNDGLRSAENRGWDASNLKECEGDCDSDSDCSGNLKCYYNALPPGCTGSIVSTMDYCYDSSNSGNVLPAHPAFPVDDVFPMKRVVQPWSVDDYLLLLLVLMLVVNVLTAAVMCMRKCCWRNSKAAVVVYDDDDKL